MSSASAALDRPEPPTSVEGVNLPALAQLLESTVSSTQPAVVFSSITHLCVPALCSACTVALTEADQQSYTITRPRDRQRPDRGSRAADTVAFGGIVVTRDSVVTEIRSRPSDRHPGYGGVLVMDFPRPRPEHALLGQLIANHGIALVELERAGESADGHRRRAENLTTALETNREIAVAIGIVMSRNSLTEEQAFELLRRSSGDTQRKIRDIAADIVQTGEIDIPRSPSTRRGHNPRRRPVAAPSAPDPHRVSTAVTFGTRFVAAANRLEVSGELDLLTTPRLIAAAAETRPGLDLVVDLTRVTFLDASALRGLVELHRALAGAGLRLTVAGASPATARIFALGRVSWLLANADHNILDHLTGAVVAAAHEAMAGNRFRRGTPWPLDRPPTGTAGSDRWYQPMPGLQS